MINKNRIVPVTKTDLLTLYATNINFVLTTSEANSLTILNPEDVQGNFLLKENSGVMYFCNQPVKSLNISTIGPVTVFFVAAYDFEKVYVNEEDVFAEGSLLNSDVIKDCATLYFAYVNIDAVIKIGAVTPVGS